MKELKTSLQQTMKMIRKLIKLIDYWDSDIELIIRAGKYSEALNKIRGKQELQSVKELRKIASKLGIPYYAHLSKAVLLSLINDRTNEDTDS